MSSLLFLMYNEYKKVQTIYNIIIINNIHFNFTNNIHFIWLFQNIFIYIDFVLCISLTYILLSYPLFTLDVSISYFLCIMQVNSGFRWQSCVCVWFIRRGLWRCFSRESELYRRSHQWKIPDAQIHRQSGMLGNPAPSKQACVEERARARWQYR